MKSSSKVTAIFAAVMLAVVNPARSNDKIVAVSGDSLPSDCGVPKNADPALAMNGSLTGCLAIFIKHLNCRELNGFAFSTELGREEFEGSLNGKPIKFDTQYTFTATWPSGSCPAPASEKEMTGSCIHYVSGENFGGLIRFYDVIPTVGLGASNFFYEGFLTRD